MAILGQMTMKREVSAGILVYRFQDGELQVLLGKCGGPKYSRMYVGAWNIPKGHVEEGEDLFSAALREFTEETSLRLGGIGCGETIDLGEAVTKSGKVVRIYATERDFTPGKLKVPIRSNMCETEWPPNSGKTIMVPELSEAFYFKANVAKRMIFSYQSCFIDRLEEKLACAMGEGIGEQAEGGAAAPTPGVTVGSVFGGGSGCTDSLVQPKPKADGDPGVTTSDVSAMYVPHGQRKRRAARRAGR